MHTRHASMHNISFCEADEKTGIFELQKAFKPHIEAAMALNSEVSISRRVVEEVYVKKIMYKC